MADHHDRSLCGAKRKGGKPPCEQPSGWGTAHPGYGRCKLHGGSTNEHPSSPTMQTYSQAQAAASMARLGFEAARDTDPQSELLRQVSLAASRVDSLAYQHQQAQVALEAASEGREKRQAAALVVLLATQYDAERFNTAKISAMAIKAGVARRQVELAERQGAALFMIIQSVLTQLGLPQETQLAARSIIAGEFRRLAETA